MNLHKLLGALLTGIGLLAATAPAHAQQDTLATIRSTQKIRIGMDDAVAPYAFKDEKLKLTGSDTAVAEALAADLGVQLEIVPLSSANRIPFLITNKVDLVISTLAITA